MSGESSECFPLTRLQDNLHSEIFEHRGKREKNPADPLSFPFILLSKEHLAEVACIGSARCLPHWWHLPASSWEERCAHL